MNKLTVWITILGIFSFTSLKTNTYLPHIMQVQYFWKVKLTYEYSIPTIHMNIVLCLQEFKKNLEALDVFPFLKKYFIILQIIHWKKLLIEISTQVIR